MSEFEIDFSKPTETTDGIPDRKETTLEAFPLKANGKSAPLHVTREQITEISGLLEAEGYGFQGTETDGKITYVRALKI